MSLNKISIYIERNTKKSNTESTLFNRDKKENFVKIFAQNTGEKGLSWYLLPQTFCMKRTVTLF